MHTITKEYKVYSFDELSEEAKSKAHSDYLNSHDFYPWEREVENCIEELNNLFHIKIRDWEYGGYCSYSYDIKWDDWFWDYDYAYKRKELSGNRARAFLWNNFGDVLYEMRHYGKYLKNENTGKWHYQRTSRVLAESRVYDGTCPLTGTWIDNSALDPMAYFCFGVKWNKDLRKFFPDRRDAFAVKRDEGITVEDIITDCVDSLFREAQDDYEYYQSREHFEEECRDNDWEFLENGKMFW